MFISFSLIESWFMFDFLSEPYDAQVADLRLSNDRPISGERCGYFNSSTTRLSTWGMGPHGSGTMISFSMWIRAFSSEEMVLVHYGAAWGSQRYDSERDIFSLTLNSGRPRLYAREGRMLTTTKDMALNDGQWHHIAVSMPQKHCLLSQVEMIINGRKVETTGPSDDEALFFINYGRVSLGGLGYSASNYESRFPNWSPYRGSMDRFILWARPITSGDISWSMNKNFQTFEGSACDETDISWKRVVKKSQQESECRRRCFRHVWCFGYQSVPLDDNNNFQCTLYPVRPKKGAVRGNSTCAAVM